MAGSLHAWHWATNLAVLIAVTGCSRNAAKCRQCRTADATRTIEYVLCRSPAAATRHSLLVRADAYQRSPNKALCYVCERRMATRAVTYRKVKALYFCDRCKPPKSVTPDANNQFLTKPLGRKNQPFCRACEPPEVVPY